MSLLMRCNFREIGVEVQVETGVGEVRCREVGEAFGVEGVLEVLEVEGELEDVDVAVGGIRINCI